MKRISVFLLAAATLAVATIGCNSAGSSGDPKAVLIAFSEKLGKQDFDGAAQLATVESKPFILIMKKSMEMMKGMAGMMPEQAKEQSDLNEVKMGDAKINGDIALIPFTTKGQPTFDFPLKKQDGGWKVDFSKETMQKMGVDPDANLDEINNAMDEMKESGMMDTVKKTIDASKKYITPENIEQLKKAGKDAEKMAEEMKKKMKQSSILPGGTQ